MYKFCFAIVDRTILFGRNEGYQEELWRISFNYLKDHLSCEAVEKYGPQQAEVGQEASGESGTETAGDGAALAGTGEEKDEGTGVEQERGEDEGDGEHCQVSVGEGEGTGEEVKEITGE